MRLHVDVHLNEQVVNGVTYWRARWTGDDGRQQSRSLGRKGRVTKREAQRMCRQLERDFASDASLATRPARLPTLAELVREQADARADTPSYRVWNRTATIIEQWDSECPIDPPRAKADSLHRHLYDLGLGHQTVRHHVARIRTAIGHAIKRELLSVNRFDHLPAGVIKRDKSWDHIEAPVALAVIEAETTPADLALALALARFGALRSNEIDRLEWGDVDLGSGVLLVLNSNPGGEISTKKRTRKVPIQPTLHRLLSGTQTPRHGRVCGTRSIDAIRLSFPDACDAAGVEPWPEPFQCPRRCCITDWCSDGLSVADVAEIAGNSAEVIMRHYHKVRPETIRRITQNTTPRDRLRKLVEQLPEDVIEKAIEAVTGLEAGNGK